MRARDTQYAVEFDRHSRQQVYNDENRKRYPNRTSAMNLDKPRSIDNDRQDHVENKRRALGLTQRKCGVAGNEQKCWVPTGSGDISHEAAPSDVHSAHSKRTKATDLL